MVYVPPTLDQFKTRFPSFANVPEATLEMIFAEAVNAVGETWTERDRPLAVMYFAAHLLASEGYGVSEAGDAAGGGGAATLGQVRKRKVGDVEVEFGGVSRSSSGGGGVGTAAWLSTTEYGKRYLRLLRLNHPGPLVV
jgi:hypothetical protein